MNYFNITIKLITDKDICRSFRKLKVMHEIPHLFSPSLPYSLLLLKSGHICFYCGDILISLNARCVKLLSIFLKGQKKKKGKREVMQMDQYKHI